MTCANKHFWQSKFWWKWVAANAIAELIGLGTVAAVGFVAFNRAGEPYSVTQAVMFASAFVFLGAFEGAVVGVAQRAVLILELPALRSWVGATIVGAMFAWAIGMLPSTLMSLGHSSDAAPADEPALGTVLLLAAALGAVAGPLLAVFQWRRLRKLFPTKAAVCWLPANAAAWALAMPVIFLGTRINEMTSNALIIGVAIALALLLAGGIAGAVHGRVLLWLLSLRQVRRSQ